MKIEIAEPPRLIRIARLVVGIAGTVQGIMIKEFALSLAGFFLVYMAIASIGNFGTSDLEIILEEAKELEHEKVDARL